ncbi:uncharacterized protein MONBRDRAFT_4839 [Monosiga brevicollis MX1]|uniref:Uncharacterized protein n=1 Tax=Monosiga brevicollis TaxID=81824 RepID=A9UP37_MONBE|nr:uncharacterized protein MONBRDRAFT_4839 [Monosiga brevicollis MX1]EDQ92352.1 predicted protein [Monosiga brevicollis MX1]|eukprot:XP_001742114.1 hypothetical protein [Monosiga brevicollis MX1]
MAATLLTLQVEGASGSELTLTSASVSSEDVPTLVQALNQDGRAERVRTLTLERLSVANYDVLAPLVACCPNTECLRLNRLVIRPESGAATASAGLLGQQIGSLRHLRELNLDHNDLRDAVLLQLGRGLEHAPALHTLSLRDNELTADAGIAMAKVLIGVPSLQQLDLSLNNLGDSGIVALSHSAGASGLRGLHLDGNFVTAVGGEALADSLCMSQSLEELSVQDNKLGDQGMAAIERLLEQIPTLTRLSSRGNKSMLSGTAI